MSQKLLLCCVLCCCWGAVQTRPIEPITVTQQTVRIRGEQRLFYALETGDVLLFEAASANGKPLKSVSIWVYDQKEVWKSEKSTPQVQTRLTVPKRAVYEIRIHAGAPKEVQLILKRLPKYDFRADFDTQVGWRTITDTIRHHYRAHTQVVYDTSYQTHYRRVCYRRDQRFHTLANRTERVYSKTHLQGASETTLSFKTPSLQSDEGLEEHLQGVGFWVGVGQEGLENYNQELKKFLGTVAIKIGSKNMLAGLVIGAYAVVTNPPQGDNIYYQWKDAQGHVLDQGNITSAYGHFALAPNASFTLQLTNDNLINGLNIHIKIVAVVEQRYYRQEGYQVRTVTPLKLEETRGRVRLVRREVPVINNW